MTNVKSSKTSRVYTLITTDLKCLHSEITASIRSAKLPGFLCGSISTHFRRESEAFETLIARSQSRTHAGPWWQDVDLKIFLDKGAFYSVKLMNKQKPAIPHHTVHDTH